MAIQIYIKPNGCSVKFNMEGKSVEAVPFGTTGTYHINQTSAGNDISNTQVLNRPAGKIVEKLRYTFSNSSGSMSEYRDIVYQDYDIGQTDVVSEMIDSQYYYNDDWHNTEKVTIEVFLINEPVNVSVRVNPNSGTILLSVNSGSNVSYSAITYLTQTTGDRIFMKWDIPPSGKEFDEFRVFFRNYDETMSSEVVSYGNESSFTIPATAVDGDTSTQFDVRYVGLNAIWKNITPKYVVTASTSTSGGSITPSGTVETNEGVARTFTITPDANYTIDSVLVDGTAVSLVNNTYTFPSSTTGNHTIVASFTEYTPPLSESYIQYTGVPLTAGTYNVECQDDNGNPITLVVNVVSSGPPGPGPDPPSQESYIQYSGRPLTPGRYGPIACTNDNGDPISLYINVEGLPVSNSRCSLTRYDKEGISVWDIPNVQSIETTDSAQLTEISTIIYGFDNNFCMDTGTVEKYTITFRRVQPFDCDDGSSDPADWSNGYWFIRFKEFIDGWQNLNYGIVDGEWVRTGGFKFHFEPGTESYRDDEPYSDLHPIIDRTVFINGTISMSMSGSNLQYINVSLPLSVGSMIRHKQTVGGHEVTLDSDIQDIGTYAARYPVGFNFPAPNAPLKWLLRPETGLMSFKHWYPGTSTGTAIYPGTIVEYSINRLTATWDSPIATYEFTENTTLSTFPSGAKRMRLWVISGAGGGGGGAQRAIYSRRAGGGGGSGGFLASALGFDSTGLISMTFTIGAGGAGGGGGMTPTDGGNGGDSTVTMTYQGEGSEIYDVLVASVAGGRGGKAPPNGGAGGSGGSDGGVSGNSAGVEVVTRPDGTTHDWHVGGNGGVPSGLPVTLGQYSIPSVAGAGGTRESGGGGNGDGYGAGGGGGAQGTYRGGAGSGGYILIAFYA